MVKSSEKLVAGPCLEIILPYMIIIKNECTTTSNKRLFVNFSQVCDEINHLPLNTFYWDFHFAVNIHLNTKIEMNKYDSISGFRSGM